MEFFPLPVQGWEQGIVGFDAEGLSSPALKMVLTGWLRELPLREKVSRIFFHRSACPGDEAFGNRYGVSDAICLASAAPGGIVNFWRYTAGAIPSPDLFWHEVGHAIGVGGGAPDRDAWHSAQIADAAHLLHLGLYDPQLITFDAGKPAEIVVGGYSWSKVLGRDAGPIGVTQYGRINEREDWADAFVLSQHSNRFGGVGTRLDGSRVSFSDLFAARAAILSREVYRAPQPTRSIELDLS